MTQENLVLPTAPAAVKDLTEKEFKTLFAKAFAGAKNTLNARATAAAVGMFAGGFTRKFVEKYGYTQAGDLRDDLKSEVWECCSVAVPAGYEGEEKKLPYVWHDDTQAFPNWLLVPQYLTDKDGNVLTLTKVTKRNNKKQKIETVDGVAKIVDYVEVIEEDHTFSAVRKYVWSDSDFLRAWHNIRARKDAADTKYNQVWRELNAPKEEEKHEEKKSDKKKK